MQWIVILAMYHIGGGKKENKQCNRGGCQKHARTASLAPPELDPDRHDGGDHHQRTLIQSLRSASAAAAPGIYVSSTSIPAMNRTTPRTPSNSCAIILVTAAIARIGTKGSKISISCMNKTPGKLGQGVKCAFSNKNTWAHNNGKLIERRIIKALAASSFFHS